MVGGTTEELNESRIGGRDIHAGTSALVTGLALGTLGKGRVGNTAIFVSSLLPLLLRHIAFTAEDAYPQASALGGLCVSKPSAATELELE